MRSSHVHSAPNGLSVTKPAACYYMLAAQQRQTVRTLGRSPSSRTFLTKKGIHISDELALCISRHEEAELCLAEVADQHGELALHWGRGEEEHRVLEQELSDVSDQLRMEEEESALQLAMLSDVDIHARTTQRYAEKLREESEDLCLKLLEAEQSEYAASRATSVACTGHAETWLVHEKLVEQARGARDEAEVQWEHRIELEREAKELKRQLQECQKFTQAVVDENKGLRSRLEGDDALTGELGSVHSELEEMKVDKQILRRQISEHVARAKEKAKQIRELEETCQVLEEEKQNLRRSRSAASAERRHNLSSSGCADPFEECKRLRAQLPILGQAHMIRDRFWSTNEARLSLVESLEAGLQLSAVLELLALFPEHEEVRNRVAVEQVALQGHINALRQNACVASANRVAELPARVRLLDAMMPFRRSTLYLYLVAWRNYVVSVRRDAGVNRYFVNLLQHMHRRGSGVSPLILFLSWRQAIDRARRDVALSRAQAGLDCSEAFDATFFHALEADRARRREVLAGAARTLASLVVRLKCAGEGARRDLRRAINYGLASFCCHEFEYEGTLVLHTYEVCTLLGRCVCPNTPGVAESMSDYGASPSIAERS